MILSPPRSGDQDFFNVIVIVYGTKNGKATGQDQIPYKVLKCNNVIYALWKLYQLCFDAGKVPSDWNMAIIISFPKSKLLDARIPANCRGVSLFSTMSKINTGVLNARLREHSEDILTDEQKGFREGRSCVDHIYSLSAIVTNTLNDKQSIFATFIDFKKALDFVNRDFLLFSLIENGMGNVFAIKSIY